ncbi:DUF4402 domain-containing protein [Pseudoalteromonas sp. B5MOD-1]|jgi:hypothetical protein|uniref:DUF4402 domain-containing protein n=1 Tax=Pseudoalteromonas TaxID=53246 RepID=UPI00078522EB|nr:MULTISPECIES: DUF4402 domain-containing protein [Pseudoalteromonas]KZY42472.1 hypothetical protein A3733_19995 [Pseudoalteromonas shioyasakiensis]MCK8127107.1 DUF4402 domain-containing protein [Pseudoalteromonas sp. 2CM39R]MCO7207351.1 DUF4402 domain-containing protein [Pseudoalteromonas sp. CnMc7-37]MCZ4252605.1 DUF4402 domain-containing protein [Pseudoalteromonas shioyasakiensis]NRA81321.1 DUF4402 domain-containing protein [Pseudoalteromonas sp.]|tara:strand:- start:1053 stop:1520 length:468 start_codon:yes stop_codon:yes gene_type:complete
MRFLLLATVLFSVFSLPLQAASTEQQALDFGTLVILANTNTSSVIVKDDGSINTQGSVYVLENGHPAELLLTDFPARTQLTMNLVAPVDLIHDVDGNTSAEFSVRLNGFPKYVITNEFGEAKVFIGGILTTDRSAKAYADGHYSSSTYLEISVDY